MINIPPYIIALTQYGVSEQPGTELNNPVIISYFHTLGFSSLNTDETGWCTALVSWCLYISGTAYSNSLLARSYLNLFKEVSVPVLGDLCIFWRIKKDSIYGHIGFFISSTSKNIYVLGGNQSNQVCISLYSKDKLLGFRRIQ